MSQSTFKPWLGAIISEFVSGVFHGSVVGAGTITAVDTASNVQTTGHGILWATAIAAIIGGVKDIALYIQTNPMPNVFSSPTIAPVPGPVATPTVSDQQSTLTQPSATTKP